MSGPAAVLHSDHVNLLIFRYLQEVGFESTATAFHSDWHRPSDYYDPENLPFAREVQRNELVSVIQAGLFHDDLESRIKKGQRRFRWTGIEPRESIERHDGALENGAGMRPASSGKAKARHPMRRPNDFPTPAPKRQRISEGSEAQINGERDPMDMDAASGSGDAEDDGEAASPAIQSELDQVEAVERYDSMDVATQTEMKAGPKTTTIHWKVDRPDALVMHSLWSPQNSAGAKSLLTTGESLCRFYDIPPSSNDARLITHTDEPTMPENAVVTAAVWRPDGLGACCAVDGLRDLPDGSKLTLAMLIQHNKDGPSLSLSLASPLLEPPGIVTSLKYSPDSQQILVARSNMKRGLVQIWKSSRPNQESPEDVASTREPIAWHVFDSHIDDIVWTSNDTFVVCGDDGLSALYQVDESQRDEVAAVPGGSVAIRALIPNNSNILATSDKIDRVRFDRKHKIAVFVISEAKKMIVTPRLYDSEAKPDADVEIELPEEPIALAFRPWSPPEGEGAAAADLETPSQLAVAFIDGTCLIYNINRSPDVGAKCSELASLSLSEPPALAIAWSPNGEHLAVGNGELVQIWSAESLKRKNGVRHVAEASVTWRPARETNGLVHGDLEEPKPLAEPSLSWSADGESLAFAAEQQIAVIRFTPPLNGEVQDIEMNGRLSP